MPPLSRTGLQGRPSRRRGEILESAIYEATLAERSDVGYGGLTIEGVAARARTGKAALYRRWYGKRELIQAAMVFALPPVSEPRPGRSARANLLTAFTSYRDLLAGKTGYPSLKIIGQFIHEPELRSTFAKAVMSPRLNFIESIFRAGTENGEIDPATVGPWTAQIGPALIGQHFVLTGAPPPRRELALIVDTLIPPLPVT